MEENNEKQAEEIIRQRESLGKASHLQQVEKEDTAIENIGWVPIKLETLPSQGIFYPVGTQILIRAARGSEIRHWSSLDEEDILSIDDALSRIVDMCCRVRFPGSPGIFKDIKEIDRFFIVFAIREITFVKGQNTLNATFECTSCGKKDTREIKKEMLKYYTAPEELQKRFSHEERCFHLKLAADGKATGEEIKLYLPSIGVMKFLTTLWKEKRQNKQEVDLAFSKWAPFLFPDWRSLNENSYTHVSQDSMMWSPDKISVVDWFVEEMQKSIKPEVTHKCGGCGTEVTAPLNFRVKSIFLVPDITGKLL